MGLLDAVERWATRRSFSRYVSPSLMKAIESDPSKFAIRPPESRHFQFVIVSLDDSNPDDLPALIRSAVDTLFEHRAMLDCMTCSLVTGLLGWPDMQDDSPEKRAALVAALVANNPNRVRVAHGQCTGLFGNFGGSKRFHWGGIIPGFSDALKKLLDSPFGTAIEIQQ